MNNQNRDIEKNFITELYNGNIDPQSREFRKDSFLKKTNVDSRRPRENSHRAVDRR